MQCGDAWVAQRLSICGWVKALSRGLGIKSRIGFPTGSLILLLPVSLPLPPCLSWINKIFSLKCNIYMYMYIYVYAYKYIHIMNSYYIYKVIHIIYIVIIYMDNFVHVRSTFPLHILHSTTYCHSYFSREVWELSNFFLMPITYCFCLNAIGYFLHIWNSTTCEIWFAVNLLLLLF